ncbi:DUF2975 domain-containing protein [Alteriqipengyuania lutimaris]|uniref:DUF2975 domain-containing protein n=1 Tax=Alteriqipengyuania lutimaris TaxID=1538146 RepID=A0A395LIH4_9SPHN|nr:DUF2975 domain-containing protein [Alteriqipengyuania lutimaris]MBB3034636.1 hypothetical protein [Alteriqipengyuania lutimaris]RDS76491.1 DUF2975 domain-containing protein [Alteriqipengyuania lutimaris]
MTKTLNDPLLLIGKIFTIVLQAVMALGSVALLIAIPAVLIAQGPIEAEIAQELPGFTQDFPGILIAAILAIGLAFLVMLFFFFGMLRQIIGTVGDGDPFQPANARRLSNMAWLMLGTQLLVIPAGIIAFQLTGYADAIEAAGAENFNMDFDDDGFDMTAWLLVVILFILARVFRHGAAMREDLEGTV